MNEIIENFLKLSQDRKQNRDDSAKQFYQENKIAINDYLNSIKLQDYEDIIGLVFPENNYSAQNFYDFLINIEVASGFNKEILKYLGILWAFEFNKKTGKENQEQFLKEFVESVWFWNCLRFLDTFILNIDVDIDLFYSIFNLVLEKIKKHLAQGAFFEAIEIYSREKINDALLLLDKYLHNDLPDLYLAMPTTIIGAIRSRDKSKIEKIEKELLDSNKFEIRSSIYKSWISTNRFKKLTDEEAIELINFIKYKESNFENNFEDAFRLIDCSFLNRKNTDDESILIYINWLKQNISSEISPSAKYLLINILNTIIRLPDKYISDSIELLCQISPILPEYVGIWNQIDFYLYNLLQKDQESFQKCFKTLIVHNEDLFKSFDKYCKTKFSSTFNELRNYDCNKLITELYFSENKTQRIIGKLLFDELEIKSFDSDILDSFSAIAFERALLEAIAKPFIGEFTGNFYKAIEKKVATLNENLKNLYREEMIFQAINYPGNCLDIWKKAENKTDFLSDIIEKAEKYLEKRKDIANSPINSFSCPGIEIAIKKGMQKLDKEIKDGMQEQSVFMSLIGPPIIAIYGNKNSLLRNNKIEDVSNFSEFGHSIEIPIIELLDPEGMKIKRLNAFMKLAQMEK